MDKKSQSAACTSFLGSFAGVKTLPHGATERLTISDSNDSGDELRAIVDREERKTEKMELTKKVLIKRLQKFGEPGHRIIKGAAAAARKAGAEASAGGRAAKRQRLRSANPSDAKSEAGASSGDSVQVVDRETNMLPESPAHSVAAALEDDAAIAVDTDAAAAADSDGGTASLSNADMPVAATSDSDAQSISI
eukprot:9197-Heterococcus_DN1.PRE.2